ncbi:MAG: thymidine phosphorylase [Candidatus Altiarchaeota archaeon]|nr:thymidine phosphorylase [Candidatus Altiarchaeota archaeon]
MFKVHKIDIESGGVLTVGLNKETAKNMNLNVGDRVEVFWDKKSFIAVLEVSKKAIPIGTINILRDAWKKFRVPDEVHVKAISKPRSVDYIKSRLLGNPITAEQIREIVSDIMHNRLSAVESTYFVASAYVQRLSFEEEEALTRAIVDEGEVLKFEGGPILDKHCIGGVPGNRTTPIVVPIVAAAGFLMPKTSSKAITSPAGTADVMEVLSDVSFGNDELVRIVKEVGAVLAWGGSLQLAPVDDMLLKLRYPLRLDPISFLLASILAKKFASGAEKVLIDIPLGAKVRSMKAAQDLASRFKRLGSRLGMEVKVVITEGGQPIGNGIGPALEARDIVLTLQGKGPKDLREKCLLLSGTLLEMAGKNDGYSLAKELLDSGAAYKKFKEIIAAQKGNPDIQAEDIALCPKTHDILATKDINNIRYSPDVLTKIARKLGTPSIKGAGIYLHVLPTRSVNKGGKIMTLYAPDDDRLEAVLEFLKEKTFVLDNKQILDTT